MISRMAVTFEYLLRCVQTVATGRQAAELISLIGSASIGVESWIAN